ncbi:MAG: hypothetical protein BZY87_05255 [SAR202 cluster bacterium Io17-Chloro-G6]|nr:MAG: hypothetical protein BZY87_05255 [SAR202 cluster bacterium Io17-Chloro-G6]
MAVLWLVAPTVHGQDGPQDTSCGGAQIVIEGGAPPRFTLPSQVGETLDIAPNAVLTIRGVDLPADTVLHWGVRGLGTELAGKDLRFTSGATTLNVADFSLQARGIYEIEGTLFDALTELCTMPFRVNISGFGGATAYTATGVSALAGAGALASASLAANGLGAKVDAKVEVARRRPRGWRRWIPVPAWKRSMISTLLGAVTGLGLAVLMQQAGVSPLSLANALWGLVLGGGISFGVGYSLGVIKTFLKSPVEV